MNNLFRNFVLIPNIFLLVFIGSLTISNNPLHYLFMFCIVAEHINNWNNKFENNTSDIRIFFPEQYLNFLYNVITFFIFVISSLAWSFISWWCIFLYILNFLIFRIFSSSGIEALENLKTQPSEFIAPDLDIWKYNKSELLKLCQNCSNINLKESIINEIEYSSFLRTDIAKEKISSAKLLLGSELEAFLKDLKSLL